MLCMKTKLIIVSALTVISLGFITSTFVQAKPEVATVQETPIVTVEVVEKPVVTAPEAPQETLVVETVPEPVIEQTPVVEVSNEGLISEYNWGHGSNRISIDYIIWMFPEKFIDSEREASFAYLKLVTLSNKVIGDEPKVFNSIDTVKWYFMQHFTKDSWVNVGKLTGVLPL
jgi:hypothetical protein